MAEPAGHHISHVSGVSGVMHLMYNQSWPLLVKPHLVTMIQLCCMMFYLFAIGYGNYMWFVIILILDRSVLIYEYNLNLRNGAGGHQKYSICDSQSKSPA